jgi:hypothetical protein
MSWLEGVKYAEERYCPHIERDLIGNSYFMGEEFGKGIRDYVDYFHEVLDNL